MSKISISKNEWYPVYTLDTEPASYEKQIEVSAELIEEYSSVLEHFNELQQTIKSLFNEFYT